MHELWPPEFFEVFSANMNAGSRFLDAPKTHKAEKHIGRYMLQEMTKNKSAKAAEQPQSSAKNGHRSLTNTSETSNLHTIKKKIPPQVSFY